MLPEGLLADIYKTDFLMMKEHGISLTELEEMIPYERQVFIALIIEYISKKAQAMNQ